MWSQIVGFLFFIFVIAFIRSEVFLKWSVHPWPLDMKYNSGDLQWASLTLNYNLQNFFFLMVLNLFLSQEKCVWDLCALKASWHSEVVHLVRSGAELSPTNYITIVHCIFLSSKVPARGARKLFFRASSFSDFGGGKQLTCMSLYLCKFYSHSHAPLVQVASVS